MLIGGVGRTRFLALLRRSNITLFFTSAAQATLKLLFTFFLIVKNAIFTLIVKSDIILDEFPKRQFSTTAN